MRFHVLILLLCLASASYSQSVIGAWERTSSNDMIALKSYMIITDGFVVTTTLEVETGSFISTRLEEWLIVDSTVFKVQLIFDTEYPEAEGGEYDAEMSFNQNKLILDGEEWVRINGVSETIISGIWKMSGAKYEGKPIVYGPDHPRMEVKIVSGGRFQWIDFDKNSRAFSASAGGKCTFENGKYTEYFEFFSNQPTWIGDSITFKASFKENKWFHYGVLPDEMIVDEIWTRLN